VAAPEVASDLVAPTMQFIRRVGYRGLGSLQFKRDCGSGRFVIIEPTVERTDWQEEIATLRGLNLPLMTYLSETERPLPEVDQLFSPIAWRSSASSRAPLAAGMHIVDGFFRWPDPLPALYYYGYKRGLLRFWRRTSGRSPHNITAVSGTKE